MKPLIQHPRTYLPYMDAPTLSRLSFIDGSQEEIAPVHSDFWCDLSVAVHDGFCWTAPIRLSRTRGAAAESGFAFHGLTCFAITA